MVTQATKHKTHNWSMIVVVAVVGLGVWGILAWRTNTQTGHTNHLCGILAAIIQQQDKIAGTRAAPGFTHYKKHPHDLVIVHRTDKKILDELACMPIKLSPSG